MHGTCAYDDFWGRKFRSILLVIGCCPPLDNKGHRNRPRLMCSYGFYSLSLSVCFLMFCFYLPRHRESSFPCLRRNSAARWRSFGSFGLREPERKSLTFSFLLGFERNVFAEAAPRRKRKRAGVPARGGLESEKAQREPCPLPSPLGG